MWDSNKTKAFLTDALIDLFYLYKKAQAVVAILLGIVILWFSLSWLTDTTEKPVIYIECVITKYDVSDSSSGVSAGDIRMNPTNKIYDSLSEKTYYFHYIKSFDAHRFEKMGGGVGAQIKLGIDSTTTGFGQEIQQIDYKNSLFIDASLKHKLQRTNQWYAFACALFGLGAGFGLLKLMRMIKAMQFK